MNPGGMAGPAQLLQGVGAVLGGLACAYAALALWSVLRANREPRPGEARASQRKASPPVSVLKPLHGLEPGLEEGLRSLCAQAYPAFEVVCGVSDPKDPAIGCVQRIAREFPGVHVELVVDPRRHGASGKVSNLVNMAVHARHELLVLSDADVLVPTGWLDALTRPLADPQVGLVTCAYRGVAEPGAWSLLGTAFINEWFMPSVRVGQQVGSSDFVSGVSIGMRRSTLEAIGGFAALRDQLADDHRLGTLTRARGLRTVVCPVEVTTRVREPNARALLQHELRWLRTIRAVRPGAYAALFPTFPLPLALIGAALGGFSGAGNALLWLSVGLRTMLHFAAGWPRSAPRGPPVAGWRALGALWTLPVGDGLAFALWMWGFASRQVVWRNTRFRVARDGSVTEVSQAC